MSRTTASAMLTARINGGMHRYQYLVRSVGKTWRATRLREPSSAEYCLTTGNQPALAVPAVEWGHHNRVSPTGTRMNRATATSR